MKIEKLFHVFSHAIKSEFKTDAGKMNFLGFIGLIIYSLATLIPDITTTIYNVILILLGKSVPATPSWIQIFYFIVITLFMVWCVRFVSKRNLTKQNQRRKKNHHK